jgi:hypothetical protein
MSRVVWYRAGPRSFCSTGYHFWGPFDLRRDLGRCRYLHRGRASSVGQQRTLGRGGSDVQPSVHAGVVGERTGRMLNLCGQRFRQRRGSRFLGSLTVHWSCPVLFAIGQ